jgi:protein TonB
MPIFGDGGVDKFCYWVMTHVKYPKRALERCIEGVVLVQFVVPPDGKARDFKVVKSPDKSLLKSVIATIKEANKLDDGWKPGRNGGEPVKVSFTLPVSFSLK